MKTGHASTTDREPASEDAARATGVLPKAESPAERYAAGRVRRARRARRAIMAALSAAVLSAALFWAVRALRRPPPVAPAPIRDFSRFASPALPLDRGLALVVVLAMDCGHCRQTAQMVGTFDAEALGLRIYLILSGKPEEVDPFFEAVGVSMPYYLATTAEYLDFVVDDPTTVCLLNNGDLRTEWPGSGFNLSVLRDELAKER